MTYPAQGGVCVFHRRLPQFRNKIHFHLKRIRLRSLVEAFALQEVFTTMLLLLV